MKSRRWIFYGIGGVVAVIIAWHLLIDLSWFVEECPDCGSDWDSIEYRVVNFPVSKYRRANTMMLEVVCTDLGIPCTHPNLIRWHRQRRWGLWICACPCRNGIDGLAGDADDYTPAMSARVKAMAKENPKLGEEFRQRVLVRHDYDYWHAFAERMKAP